MTTFWDPASLPDMLARGERCFLPVSPIVDERLESHLIPTEELANGGYQSLSEDRKVEKLKDDFDVFLRKRAELVNEAVKLLADGRQISTSEVVGRF